MPGLVAFDAGDDDNDMKFECAPLYTSEQEASLRIWSKQARKMEPLIEYLDEHLPRHVLFGSEQLLLGLTEDDLERAVTQLTIVVGILAFAMKENTALVGCLMDHVDLGRIFVAVSVANGTRKRVPLQAFFNDTRLVEEASISLPVDELKPCVPSTRNGNEEEEG